MHSKDAMFAASDRVMITSSEKTIFGVEDGGIESFGVRGSRALESHGPQFEIISFILYFMSQW